VPDSQGRRDQGGQEEAVDAETARVRGIYETMAPRYDRVIAVAERLLFGDGRRWACARASGRVLEVAVGTGRNLACYPADVQLTGVELSPGMLAQAQARAETLHRRVDLRLGDAQHLTFPDATFDPCWPPSPCAASPTTRPPSGRWPGYCDLGATGPARPRRQPHAPGPRRTTTP